MPTELLEDFDGHPWARALLSSPNHENFSTPTRLGSPPFATKAPTRLITETLFTDSTIRAQQRLRTTELVHPGLSREHLLLYSLAEGLNGWEGVLYGGFMGVIVDYAAGCCSTDTGLLNQGKDFVLNATKEMKIEYKRPVRLPGIVLVRAVMTGWESGRSLITVVVEDGMGVVYAKAEVTFLELRRAKL